MAARLAIAERGRPLGSPLSVWLNFRAVPFLGAGLSKLWSYTLRVRRVGFEAVEGLVARDERFILSFWHRRLFMMPLAYPFLRRGRGVAILSSDSKDGERSAATWRWFGIHAVRGTASDDGAKALVDTLRRFSAEQKADLFKDEAPLEVRCDYCGTMYPISRDDLMAEGN